MRVIQRLFPRAIGARFEGHRLALWLLGLFLALKLIMSINSIVNTEAVAVGADGFRLDAYGAGGGRAVLMLFALSAVDQLVLTLLGILALVRYRAMVPLVYLLLLGDQIGRRLVMQVHPIERAGDPAGISYLGLAMLAILAVGLGASLLRRSAAAADPQLAA